MKKKEKPKLRNKIVADVYGNWTELYNFDMDESVRVDRSNGYGDKFLMHFEHACLDTGDCEGGICSECERQ